MAHILQKKLINIENKDNQNDFLFGSVSKIKNFSYNDFKEDIGKKNNLLSEEDKELSTILFGLFTSVGVLGYGGYTIHSIFNNTLLLFILYCIMIPITIISFTFYFSKFLGKTKFVNRYSEKTLIKNYYEKFLKIEGTNFINNINQDLMNKLLCSNLKANNAFAYNSLKFQIDNVHSEFEVLKSQLKINKHRDNYTNKPFKKFINDIDNIKLKIEEAKGL